MICRSIGSVRSVGFGVGSGRSIRSDKVLLENDREEPKAEGKPIDRRDLADAYKSGRK